MSMKKPGRPKKARHEKRTVNVVIRLSPVERAGLQRLVELERRTFSDLFRTLLHERIRSTHNEVRA